MKNQRISGVSKETYRVYDENGELKRIIEKAEEKTLTENEWLKGVTCFVINEKGEALIEVRANKGLTPGKKDLCSGHLDDRETETQAMIRELREELGIELEEAMNNRFEDTDCFTDELTYHELLLAIHTWIDRYA